MTLEQAINSLLPPYFHTIMAGLSELTDLGWSLTTAAQPHSEVRWLRAQKMADIEGVFDEFAAALQFPYYFGENWAAFHECLGDLSWMEAKRYLLIVSNSSKLLLKAPLEMGALFRSLQTCAEEWARTSAFASDAGDRPPIPFHVIFHCNTPSEMKQIAGSLTGAGCKVDQLEPCIQKHS